MTQSSEITPCDSPGPRIGTEGVPRCRLTPGHSGPHKASPDDGWGASIRWTDGRYA